MNIDEEFQKERRSAISAMGKNSALNDLTNQWLSEAQESRYSYNFDWLGLPIIQYPQDIVAMQEIIWNVKPDLIIETGIARGGSVIFYASILELLSTCDLGEGSVLAVDIDIRANNKQAIEEHPLAKRIEMIEGSSVDNAIVEQIKTKAAGKKNILVCLDSNHTHEHVLAELKAYSGLVSQGSYLIVFDTLVEDISDEAIGDRPWGKGDNPKTAVHEFLKSNNCFEIERAIHEKLQVTVAPDGFLKRVR